MLGTTVDRDRILPNRLGIAILYDEFEKKALLKQCIQGYYRYLLAPKAVRFGLGQGYPKPLKVF